MTRARSSPRRRWVAYGACGLLAFGWFIWLRPTTLGGKASYVVVKGTSMEPTYDDGDLVIVREEASYGTGDIIAFRAGGQFDDPTRIIHRIVGQRDDGNFVTQGDNRDQTDPWQPSPDDIIGRASLHVPALGDAAAWAGQPQVLAALGAGAVMAGGRKRRRRRMSQLPPQAAPEGAPQGRRPPVGGGLPPRWLRHTEPRWAFLGLTVSLLLLLPVLAVAWSAIQASDTEVRSNRIGQVDLALDVDYRFLADNTPVYPDGIVRTTRTGSGAILPADPLYRRLLHRLEVALQFRASSDGTDDLISSYGADVRLEMPEGWSTTLTTIDPTPFEGSTSQLVAVDLDDASRRVQQVAELTGVGGEIYTITVTPRLQVEGSASGQPVREAVDRPAAFAVKGGVITAEPVESAHEVRQITHEVREGVDYRLGPVALDTQAARGVLSGLALVLLAAVAVCASVLFGGIGLGESDRIAARYRSQIVDVAAATGPPGPVVMVGAIEELARLAKVEQSVILHEDLGDGCHRYRVFLGAVTYEYESAPEHGGQAADAEHGSSADHPGT